MKSCNTEQEYIDLMVPAAQRACKRYGYKVSTLVAQACLENGYGILSYADNPEIVKLLAANNVVGVKSSLLNDSWKDYTVWQGESITKNTPEEYGGKIVTIKDKFRVYDTIERCFCDFLLFLTYASNTVGGKPKYGPEVLSIKDPFELIKVVNAKGYASGSTYATNVSKIIRKHDLTKYDDLTLVKPTDIVPDILKNKKEEKPTSTTAKTAKGKKLCIDCGHYGYYNQSPAVRDYWESKMTWKLGHMLQEECEKYGIIVKQTRDNQEKDMALYDRGYASKGCDLFISVHSNAVDGSVHENIDYPVCFVQISGKSDKIGTLLSECVQRVMQTKQPADHWSQQGKNGDYYGVLRGATAAGTVGCIIEHSFHTNTRSTKWLMDDNNLRKMAIAEAKVIADYLAGVETKPSSTPSSPATKSYLSKGDKGAAVIDMQSMLIACGYSCGSAGADGDFGSATDKALRAFQTSQKLTADGKYGKASKAALEALYKAKTGKQQGKPTASDYVIGNLDYSSVFDPVYYVNKYQDLKKAFGNDKKKLWAHFVNWGRKEARQASENFNPVNYRKRYHDLEVAFGDDWASYYKHWLEFGKKEGRNGQ